MRPSVHVCHKRLHRKFFRHHMFLDNVVPTSSAERAMSSGQPSSARVRIGMLHAAGSVAPPCSFLIEDLHTPSPSLWPTRPKCRPSATKR